MNAGRNVFAALALCVLSASVASAAHHHGHHSNAGTMAGASGSGASDHVTGGPATHESGVAGADSTGKTANDQPGQRSKGLSGADASNGPETVGRNQAVRPVPGGANVNGVDAPIDTSITVNQGPARRDARRDKGGKYGKEDVGAAIADIKQRLLGKPSSTAAPKTSGLLPPPHRHQPKFSTKNAASATRNAIGALVERGGTQGSAATGLHEPGPKGPGGVVGSVAGQPEPGGAPANHGSLNVLHNGHSDPEGATVIIPSVHDLSINGTHLVRPGAGLGSLGGPAKVVAGISGSNVRMKHP
jgi:hypothetical protein